MFEQNFVFSIVILGSQFDSDFTVVSFFSSSFLNGFANPLIVHFRSSFSFTQ